MTITDASVLDVESYADKVIGGSGGKVDKPSGNELLSELSVPRTVDFHEELEMYRDCVF